MFKKLLSEGLRHHQAGDLPRAGELYRKALDLQPNNPDALNLMGVLMTQAGQNDTAISLLEIAAQNAPDFAPIHVNLGNAYQAAGRLDDAILAFTNAKMADISVTEAHLNLASALIAAGRADEALESLDVVIKLAPNAAEGYNFKGNAHLQMDRLDEAAELYAQAVEKNNDFYEGWANLGNVRTLQARFEEAITAYDRALTLNPAQADLWSSWTSAMIEAGRAGDAETRIIEAVTATPKVAQLHHALGVVRKMCGATEAAIGPLQHAINLAPTNPLYQIALGEVLMDCELFDEALSVIEKVAVFNPDLAAAQACKGLLAHHLGHPQDAVEDMTRAVGLDASNTQYQANLGAFLIENGEFDTALKVLNDLLSNHPKMVEALNSRASTLKHLGQFENALTDLQTAHAARPDDVKSLTNLAAMLEASGALNEAQAFAQRALELAPNNANAHSTLGIVLKAQGEFDRAQNHLEQAIQINPRQIEAQWSLSLLQLLQGEYENGWWNYRWRWALKHRPCPYMDRKLWDGGTLHSETIVIHAEQGLGDAIQFARYIPEVVELGGKVIFTCHPPLIELYKNAFANMGLSKSVTVQPHDEPVPMTDWHAPLLGLPHLFGTTLDTVPKPGSLLQTPIHTRATLPDHPKPTGPKIGLVCSGNPKQINNHNRSAPLSAFADLINQSEARFYSLQMGLNDTDRETLDGLDNLVDLAPGINDFTDTAKLIEELDVVISVCTSVAHLSGAMCTPTWVALAHVADFRWLLEREDSPWYPSVRLFRQSSPGDWSSVAQALGTAVSQWMPAKP